jgi:hypothetical protein
MGYGLLQQGRERQHAILDSDVLKASVRDHVREAAIVKLPGIGLLKKARGESWLSSSSVRTAAAIRLVSTELRRSAASP